MGSVTAATVPEAAVRGDVLAARGDVSAVWGVAQGEAQGEALIPG
jgi:hypothetical protein